MGRGVVGGNSDTRHTDQSSACRHGDEMTVAAVYGAISLAGGTIKREDCRFLRRLINPGESRKPVSVVTRKGVDSYNDRKRKIQTKHKATKVGQDTD